MTTDPHRSSSRDKKYAVDVKMQDSTQIHHFSQWQIKLAPTHIEVPYKDPSRTLYIVLSARCRPDYPIRNYSLQWWRINSYGHSVTTEKSAEGSQCEKLDPLKSR